MPPARLEIALREELFDPAGAGLKSKAWRYLGLDITSARRIDVLTFDLSLSQEQLEEAAREILTNPVTQKSAFTPLAHTFDWLIWVGLRPGVKDNPGDTAREAIESHFGLRLGPEEKIYTSQLYVLRAPHLGREQVELITRELLANELIHRWRVIGQREWDPQQGVGLPLASVEIEGQPGFQELDIPSDQALLELSLSRSLALHPADVPVIRAYFAEARRIEERRDVGLSERPSDVELEFISQARSDHCNHNTFNGLFTYRDLATGESRDIDSLFRTCIKEPTLAIQAHKDWVVSVLWDNAGVAAFDDDWLYTITGETHNSPSNMEAYGGALTGIVGVYRDPLGTGLGSKLILGTFGYCVGPRDYQGPLSPHLHPRRLLDGVIEGVKDGGNKSGVPTGTGLVYFHPAFLGKCLVYVTALGLMPRRSAGRESWQKKPNPGDLIVMAGGRVGKDGIHGVTASSEAYSDKTPAGHVQIGDPYTQKKVMDLILEARDEGLISYLTDNGGGGLSSSVGESARLSGGAEVWLDRVPLKYPGLDMWEIWVSESQERMTLGLPPEHEERFFELAEKHGVEATVIGRYNSSGRLQLSHSGRICALVEVDFTTKGFPQWRFEAEWLPPERRGLSEPVLTPPPNYRALLNGLLTWPNLAAKNWILRQYDHEVQGGAVIKPLGGVERDTPSDAVVYRPVLTGERGLALSQCLNPTYGLIDTYDMTAATLDEAVRRLVAVGADPDQVGAVDNFCWPSIQFHPAGNPDGKYKAAQLCRACQALKDVCLAYGVPLLSGKDSMYVDGVLTGPFGEKHKVSGLCTLQITATSIVPEVSRAVTSDFKAAGDLIYLLGDTADEMGGGALYEFLGYTGLNAPRLDPRPALELYRAVFAATRAGLIRSAKALTRGGLGLAAAMSGFASAGFAGGLGLALNLDPMPCRGEVGELARLFSESCGRFLVTVAPEDQAAFEQALQGHPAAQVGRVLAEPRLTVSGSGRSLLDVSLAELKRVWLATFGDLI